jgi:hypothetical protein
VCVCVCVSERVSEQTAVAAAAGDCEWNLHSFDH